MDKTKNEKIMIFTKKWIEKFTDNLSTARDLCGSAFSDDCFDIGFKMDCGDAFRDKYKVDLNKVPEILSKVDDIDILGSAIFSNWRYYNHWAYSGDEIMSNRGWFIATLTRLQGLVK